MRACERRRLFNDFKNAIPKRYEYILHTRNRSRTRCNSMFCGPEQQRNSCMEVKCHIQIQEQPHFLSKLQSGALRTASTTQHSLQTLYKSSIEPPPVSFPSPIKKKHNVHHSSPRRGHNPICNRSRYLSLTRDPLLFCDQSTKIR